MKRSVRIGSDAFKAHLRDMAHRRFYNGPPVLILTMEKVGTQSHEKTLRQASRTQRIVAAHALVETDTRAKRLQPASLQHLDSLGEQPCSVLTGVRDPIARDISLFFEILPSVMPAKDVLSLPESELTEAFHSFVRDELPVDYVTEDEWFASYFEAPLSAQVVTEARHGSIMREVDGRRLAVIRLEDRALFAEILTFISGNRIGQQALVEKNRASQKSESRLHYQRYKPFVETAQLDENYISEKLLHSAVTRAFYSPEEIAGMRAKWSRPAI